MSEGKERFFRLESSTRQEFVIIDDDEPGTAHGIDRRAWPVQVELTKEQFEAREGERAPDSAAAEAKRRATMIERITVGELEDLIDARIEAHKAPAESALSSKGSQG